MSENKIEGVPEGWELVRVGTPDEGELYIVSGGLVGVCESPRFAKNYVIVRKIEPPKPTYVPWTYETCPIGAVVTSKDEKQIMMITSKRETVAGQMGHHCSYSELLNKWQQLDGTPCGTVEVHE